MSRKVFIFDTTLRDGEQSPGASLNAAEKMAIALQLAKLQVDTIEAGNPISSDEDFEAVLAIAEEVEGPAICALARCVPADVARAGEALGPAIKRGKGLLHVYIGTSDLQVFDVLSKTREQVLDMAISCTKQAKELCPEVEFSAMDAVRTPPLYLYEVIREVIRAGATVVNIPDTAGYAVPEQFSQLIKDVQQNVPDLKDREVRLSVHCHDDLGMATSNSLSAVKVGARQIECAVNGMGERAGNAALEEIVMAIQTRADYLDAHTDIRTQEITNTSRLVSHLMGFPVPPNKAIVGKNAFAHSSGVHQHGILKQRRSFEIMNPEDVGLRESEIVLTARSGRHALGHRLLELGYDLSDEQLKVAIRIFKMLADKKKPIDDEDLRDVADIGLNSPPVDTFSILSVSVGPDEEAGGYKAVLRVRMDGNEAEWIGSAPDGRINAAVQAMKKGMGTDFEIGAYKVRNIGEGSGALALVQVTVTHNGQTRRSKWLGTDTIETSIIAYAYGVWAAQASQEQPEAEFSPQKVGPYHKLDADTRYPIPERPESGFLVVGAGSAGKLAFFHTAVWKGGHRQSKKWTFHSIPPKAVFVSLPQYKQRKPSSRHVYGVPEFYDEDGEELL